MTISSENISKASKRRILFDVNVVLDVITRREPFFRSSAAAWELAETGEIEGMLAAHSLTTLHYLISHQTTREESILAVRKLLHVFQVAAVNQDVIMTALGFGWADFEDAVQMAAAEWAGCDYLVTRNAGDFEPSTVSVISPADLPAIIGTN